MPVLRALVRLPAFAASVGAKVRDPSEDIVATYRALGARVEQPRNDNDAANSILWQTASLGSRPFSWPRPDGPPADSESWSSPSRLLASLQVHLGMSGGWWPTGRVTYRKPTSWAPRFPVRFDELVDHLSRSMLHRRATPELLDACCIATGCRLERSSPGPRRHGWQMPRLLATVLDSPAFFAR